MSFVDQVFAFPDKYTPRATAITIAIAIAIGAPIGHKLSSMPHELRDKNLTNALRTSSADIPPALLAKDADVKTAEGIAAALGKKLTAEELTNSRTILFSGIYHEGGEEIPYDFRVADVEKMGRAMELAQQYFAVKQRMPNPPANSMQETVKRKRGENSPEQKR